MRISLIAAAVLSLVAQAASAHPTALQAESNQTAIQTRFQTAWVDHTRKAEPGDYTADAGSSSGTQYAQAEQTGTNGGSFRQAQAEQTGTNGGSFRQA